MSEALAEYVKGAPKLVVFLLQLLVPVEKIHLFLANKGGASQTMAVILRRDL